MKWKDRFIFVWYKQTNTKHTKVSLKQTFDLTWMAHWTCAILVGWKKLKTFDLTWIAYVQHMFAQ